jgi:hypothetical protein
VRHGADAGAGYKPMADEIELDLEDFIADRIGDVPSPQALT